MRWLQAASRILSREQTCIRVVVAQAKGSVPREVGACMVVGNATAWGTIGGGALEFSSLQVARDLLQQGAAAARFTVTPLGPNLGQCCGGRVSLCFQPLRRTDVETIQDGMGRAGQHVLLTREAAADGIYSVAAMDGLEEQGMSPLAIRRLQIGQKAELLKTGAGRLFVEPLLSDAPQLFLFGAGHVGKEIVHILGRHDLDIHWIDERAVEFPATVPENAHPMEVSDPVAQVAAAPEGADFLVMTHDHALDLALCDAILRKGDFRFLGLIGSSTKLARFRSRLQKFGHDPGEIARITCPIGIAELSDKRPEVIAVSVAAQLLALPGAAK